MKTLQQRQQFTQDMIDAYQRLREMLAYNEMEQRWVTVEASSGRVQFDRDLLTLIAMSVAVGFVAGLLLGLTFT